MLQNVATGATLFQPGDRRTLYRIESGALCHYMLWSDGRHDVIEFAFPGDIVGLGHLSYHVSTAQAMVDTVVSLVSDEEFESASDRDDRLSFRLASAVEREFEHLRDKSLSGPGHVPAAARVANFLLALSAMNTPEGRDPREISDDITAGFVAEQLNMSIEKLGAALLLLKKEGAVRETPSGLRIIDTATLQKVADAA
ncbi:Crp/Fnr family transcriptional regulator [Hyphomicrobium sp. CS1GBMeth3]|uniref:Crp/Fnr family transcriptional regulator n=1 Tax=Hyphomicrobium sp. CS1GBMeth3 TaxID=1892845 RepID=UPI001558C24F|nr:Crp/Fnr family transcriptional regulator [Hyphomicrobium sp. CS1GBMeth3]